MTMLSYNIFDGLDDYQRTAAMIERKPTDIWGLKFLPHIPLHDDRDGPLFSWPKNQEVSDCNLAIVIGEIERLGDRYKACMDIGVARNGERSMSHRYHGLKPKGAVYVGVDVEDKSFLNNPDENIWTIQANSHEQDRIRSFLKEKGVDKLDILAIDGWHSVNTTMNDWRYADLLSDHGVVIVHDTNHHPGDIALCEAVDENLFDIIRSCTSYDSGIAVFRRKS